MSTVHNRFIPVDIDNTVIGQQDDVQTIELYPKKEKNVCSVCYENMEDSFTTTLKCNHTYHTDCYTSYIAFNVMNKKETIDCPLCRSNVLKITIDKPDVIHIVAGENDIESQSLYTDTDDYETHNGCSSNCCATFILKLIMFGAIYFVLHITAQTIIFAR